MAVERAAEIRFEPNAAAVRAELERLRAEAAKGADFPIRPRVHVAPGTFAGENPNAPPRPGPIPQVFSGPVNPQTLNLTALHGVIAASGPANALAALQQRALQGAAPILTAPQERYLDLYSRYAKGGGHFIDPKASERALTETSRAFPPPRPAQFYTGSTQAATNLLGAPQVSRQAGVQQSLLPQAAPYAQRQLPGSVLPAAALAQIPPMFTPGGQVTVQADQRIAAAKNREALAAEKSAQLAEQRVASASTRTLTGRRSTPELGEPDTAALADIAANHARAVERVHARRALSAPIPAASTALTPTGILNPAAEQRAAVAQEISRIQAIADPVERRRLMNTPLNMPGAEMSPGAAGDYQSQYPTTLRSFDPRDAEARLDRAEARRAGLPAPGVPYRRPTGAAFVPTTVPLPPRPLGFDVRSLAYDPQGGGLPGDYESVRGGPVERPPRLPVTRRETPRESAEIFFGNATRLPSGAPPSLVSPNEWLDSPQHELAPYGPPSRFGRGRAGLAGQVGPLVTPYGGRATPRGPLALPAPPLLGARDWENWQARTAAGFQGLASPVSFPVSAAAATAGPRPQSRVETAAAAAAASTPPPPRPPVGAAAAAAGGEEPGRRDFGASDVRSRVVLDTTEAWASWERFRKRVEADVPRIRLAVAQAAQGQPGARPGRASTRTRWPGIDDKDLEDIFGVEFDAPSGLPPRAGRTPRGRATAARKPWDEMSPAEAVAEARTRRESNRTRRTAERQAAEEDPEWRDVLAGQRRLDPIDFLRGIGQPGAGGIIKGTARFIQSPTFRFLGAITAAQYGVRELGQEISGQVRAGRQREASRLFGAGITERAQQEFQIASEAEARSPIVSSISDYFEGDNVILGLLNRNQRAAKRTAALAISQEAATEARLEAFRRREGRGFAIRAAGEATPFGKARVGIEADFAEEAFKVKQAFGERATRIGTDLETTIKEISDAHDADPDKANSLTQAARREATGSVERLSKEEQRERAQNERLRDLRLAAADREAARTARLSTISSGAQIDVTRAVARGDSIGATRITARAERDAFRETAGQRFNLLTPEGRLASLREQDANVATEAADIFRIRRDERATRLGIGGDTRTSQLRAQRRDFETALSERATQTAVAVTQAPPQFREAIFARGVQLAGEEAGRTLRGAQQFNQQNAAAVDVNRLILQRDEHGAGLRAIEGRRQQELANAPGGFLGFLTKPGINRRIDAERDVFNQGIDDRQELRRGGLRAELQGATLRAGGQRIAASVEGIASGAGLRATAFRQGGDRVAERLALATGRQELFALRRELEGGEARQMAAGTFAPGAGGRPGGENVAELTERIKKRALELQVKEFGAADGAGAAGGALKGVGGFLGDLLKGQIPELKMGPAGGKKEANEEEKATAAGIKAIGQAMTGMAQKLDELLTFFKGG